MNSSTVEKLIGPFELNNTADILMQGMLGAAKAHSAPGAPSTVKIENDLYRLIIKNDQLIDWKLK